MSEETILGRIVAQRRLDVAAAEGAVPRTELEARARLAPLAIDFAARIADEAGTALIAEIKRASPSKGTIAPDIEAAAQARVYALAGAAGISVLTEPRWFKGSLEDLLDARLAVDEVGRRRPGVLRKDFVIDEYQVIEARAWGADAVLLIVACLEATALQHLVQFTLATGMTPVVEVNNADEMHTALTAGASFIGVNNRDLRTFSVDAATTTRLAALVPAGVTLAAFSGIETRKDVELYAECGARAVLVGEALVRAPEPSAKVRELVGR